MSTELTEAQLKEWRALADACPPGPFYVVEIDTDDADGAPRGGVLCISPYEDDDCDAIAYAPEHFGAMDKATEAMFMLFAAARTAVPALLDALAEARAERDALRAWIDGLEASAGHAHQVLLGGYRDPPLRSATEPKETNHGTDH